MQWDNTRKTTAKGAFKDRVNVVWLVKYDCVRGHKGVPCLYLKLLITDNILRKNSSGTSVTHPVRTHLSG